MPGSHSCNWAPLVGAKKTRTGVYQMSFKDPSGKTISDRGKYITVWKKEAGGKWKVALDIFNSDLAAGR